VEEVADAVGSRLDDNLSSLLGHRLRERDQCLLRPGPEGEFGGVHIVDGHAPAEAERSGSADVEVGVGPGPEELPAIGAAGRAHHPLHLLRQTLPEQLHDAEDALGALQVVRHYHRSGVRPLDGIGEEQPAHLGGEAQLPRLQNGIEAGTVLVVVDLGRVQSERDDSPVFVADEQIRFHPGARIPPPVQQTLRPLGHCQVPLPRWVQRW
jgi:hypothetical protein